jgi:hypothetical protein
VSSRIRCEHDRFRGSWRPGLGRPEPADADGRGVQADDAVAQNSEVQPQRSGLMRVWSGRALVWLLAAAVGWFAAGWVGLRPASTPAPAGLPVTPRAWLDGYEAAAIDNPSRVCTQLLSPALAAVYAHAAHNSCISYFSRMTSSSLTVRRVLQDGQTAVLELRQVVGHADWDVVLDRRSGGWQAVDLLTGKLLR